MMSVIVALLLELLKAAGRVGAGTVQATIQQKKQAAQNIITQPCSLGTHISEHDVSQIFAELEAYPIEVARELNKLKSAIDDLF